MNKFFVIPLLAIGALASSGVLAANICDVSYQATEKWGTGAKESVVLTNRAAAKTSWELCWTLTGNESITSIWDGSYTLNGRKMCVKNANYNGNLPTNGSASFGFTHEGFSGATPSDFSLDGVLCSGNTPPSSVPASTPASTPSSGSPITIQAEDYTAMNGIQKETTSDVDGGMNIGYIDAGDWATYPTVNLPCSGQYLIEYRVASQSGGGRLTLEKAGGSAAYGSLNVPTTGDWQKWTTISHTVTLPSGSFNFGIAMNQGGWNLNWFKVTPQCLVPTTSSSTSSSITPPSVPSTSSRISSSSSIIPPSVPSTSSRMSSSSTSSSSSAISIPSSGWTLNGGQSYLNFVTAKKTNVVEAHGFDSLSGSITPEGKATLIIDLNSVNTTNTIRDDNLRRVLFATNPTATVSVQLPATTLAGIPVGQSALVAIQAMLSLNGVTLPIDTQVFVHRITAGRLLVKSSSPIIIKASDYGYAAGVEALRVLMNLDSISNIVPVDFALVFDGSGNTPTSAIPSSSSVPTTSSSSSVASTVSQGETLYKSAALGCVNCHGATGKGGIAIDPTKSLYGGLSLVNYINKNMPANNPGTCDVNCATQIAGFIKSWAPAPSSSASSSSVPSACPANSSICLNFEDVTPGTTPAGYELGANAKIVQDGNSRSGTRSLKFYTDRNVGYGSSFLKKYSVSGTHWGRMFYKVPSINNPAGYTHTTFALFPESGETRIVDTVFEASSATHQYLLNHADDQNGKASPYDYRFDSSWVCAEWQLDSATQTYNFWRNGVQVNSISGRQDRPIPSTLSWLAFGGQVYQAGPNVTGWIDDIVVAPTRVGCQ